MKSRAAVCGRHLVCSSTILVLGVYNFLKLIINCNSYDWRFYMRIFFTNINLKGSLDEYPNLIRLLSVLINIIRHTKTNELNKIS